MDDDEAPAVTTIIPAAGAFDVTLSADLTVTFSEPVNAHRRWFALSCAPSGTKAAVVCGGPMTFTLNPATDFVASESCAFTSWQPTSWTRTATTHQTR